MSLATHSGQLFQVTIVPLDNCSSQNLFLRSFTNGHLQRGRSLEWTIEYLPQLLQSLISLTDDNRKNKDQNSNKRFALFTLSSFLLPFASGELHFEDAMAVLNIGSWETYAAKVNLIRIRFQWRRILWRKVWPFDVLGGESHFGIWPVYLQRHLWRHQIQGKMITGVFRKTLFSCRQKANSS